jgi:dihydroorotate dehydrogenase
VQIYSALIYRGPLIVGQILSGLRALLDADQRKTIAEAVGVDARAFAKP